MISKTFAAIAAVAIICTSSLASAQMAPAKTADTSKGKALVDSKGMTLYTFDKDAPGKLACVGACTGNWPPLLAATDAKAEGDYSLVKRDGEMQWAYKGKPLYRWKNDKKPGDITGDGFLNGAWHIAKP